MIGTEFDSVDETCRQSFESDWSKGQAGPIENYLPVKESEKYFGTVEELIHIDLEFRWKRFGELNNESRVASASPPSIEEYVSRFPNLQIPDVLSRLIQAEFELRSRHGDSPSVKEYQSRFPEMAKSGVKLEDFLDENDVSVESISQLKPGQNLGRYRLVAEQGRGGFAAVWRADDSKLGRRIALKRLSGHLARQSESRRRFVNEARVTAKLEHPGIVPIYDMGNLEEEHAYYTMRLIRGNTLEDAISSVYQIDQFENPSKFALKFRGLISNLIDICDTIEYCHSQGIIHRDLKPQNIICGDYGETIVLDWGLARRAEALRLKLDSVVPEDVSNENIESTRFGTIKGTPAFMSPEQAAGHVDLIDQRSDIYALGAILYQVLTGQCPFQGTVEQVLKDVRVGNKKRPTKINSTAPKPLESVCLKAMNVEQSNRYQNVSEFAEDLKRWQADETLSAHKDSLWEATARWIRKHKTLSAVLVLIVFFAVIGAAAGNILWQQYQFREAQRISELESLIESANAEVHSELAASQFSSAFSILDQAYQLIKDQRGFNEQAENFRQRRDRVRRIVEFYQYSAKAYELTFLDQLGESAIYSQEALRTIGAIEHVDWWVHLPDDDLNALQKDRLRTEVYRVFCTLAVMRAGQSLDKDFNMAMLLNPGRRKNENLELNAAAHAAIRAEAFRPAECLRLVREFSDVVNGKRRVIPQLTKHPLNATDAGIVGSILDTNTPADQMQRTALQIALGGRDPYETARLWMTQATAEAPDWYWTSIFLAQSEMHAKNFDLSVRSYSHSIGLAPDYWVGYAYRSLAYVGAAMATNNKTLRQQHLRSATLDIERARELAPNKSELYWLAAYILSFEEKTQDQAAQYFMRALWRHPKSNQLGASHFSGVTRFLFEVAETMTSNALNQPEPSSDIILLQIAIQHWKGDNERAEQLLNQYGQMVDDPELKIALSAMIHMETGNDNISILEDLERVGPKINQWHVWYALTQAQLKNNEIQKSLESARHSKQAAFDTRQQTRSLLKMAEIFILFDNETAAIDAFKHAIEVDIAVNVRPLLQHARDNSSVELTKKIVEHLERTGTIDETDETIGTIVRPALLNGDFELGIGAYWSTPEKSETFSTWGIAGKRQMIAEAIDIGDRRGKVLHVRSSGNGGEGLGATEQLFPISRGKRYKVSFWCKGKDIDANAVKLINGHTNQVLAESDTGTFDWKQFEGEFTPKNESMILKIQFESNGEFWIDQIEIQAM